MRFISLIVIIVLMCLSVESLLAKDVWSKELYLTIYNRDLALVKEIREMTLERGRQILRLSDIPLGIIPTSFQLRSLTDPNSISVLEQYYEYEPLESSTILRKYLEKEIRIVTRDGKVHQGVLAGYDAQIILIEDTGSVVLINTGDVMAIELPELPKELTTKPTLVCYIDNNDIQNQTIELDYLTRGISWNIDYVAILSKDESSLSLNGWVTINNTSGVNYDSCKLKLIAGEVMSEETPTYKMDTLKTITTAESIPQFKEEGLFEYHIYTLQKRVTLKNNQTKQISLLDVKEIPIEKVLVYDGATYRSYYYDNWKNQGYNPNVSVYIDIINREENGLGIPLPKGKIRVYITDEEDMLQFIGEDTINHTPKDERIRLSVGKAFDVTGERKILEHKRISNNIYQDTYEIILKNHKEEPVEVKVIERQWGDWKILDTNLEYSKIDANTIEFNARVPANGGIKIIYTTEYRF